MAVNVNSGVNTSFEIGYSAFHTYSGLRQLVHASSKDNVQPQAVIAAEQLGARFLICADRIGEAVGALKGHESIRIEAFKVSLGLLSGGLRKEIRKSTSLIAVFVLAAACKMCYVDDEIGSLLFEMMDVVGVLSKCPTSSVQLHQFVRSLSGHSETIVPTELMHEIAVRVDELAPSPDVYSLLDRNVLCKMICQLFEHLRDDDVHEISLSGRKHGVWLATTLLWLIGEVKARLLCNGIQFKGSVDAKLSINIDTEQQGPWNLTVWRLGSSPAAYTFPQNDRDESSTPARLPLKCTRSYIVQLNWDDPDDQVRGAEAVRTLTVALVTLIIEEGMVTLGKRCDSSTDRKKACCRGRFRNVLSDSWLADNLDFMTNYGWGEGCKMARSRSEYICELISEKMHAPGFEDSQIESLVLEQSEFVIVDQLKLCSSQAFSSVFNSATYLAGLTIFTSTCDFIDSRRYFEPLDGQSMHEITPLLFKFLSGGLEVGTFREKAFASSLAGFRDNNRGNIVASMNGYVASLAGLHDCTTNQQEALIIKIRKGQIRYQEGNRDTSFIYITEMKFSLSPTMQGHILPQDLPLLFKEFKRNHKSSEVTVSDADPSDVYMQIPDLGAVNAQFTTLVADAGERLQVKHYMTWPSSSSSDTEMMRRKASWIDSMDSLAVATHITASPHTITKIEQILIQRLQENSLRHPINCSNVKSDFFYSGESRDLVMTRGSEMQRFFAAGFVRERDICCVSVVIRHGSSLARCVIKAEETGTPWFLIY